MRIKLNVFAIRKKKKRATNTGEKKGTNILNVI